MNLLNEFKKMIILSICLMVTTTTTTTENAQVISPKCQPTCGNVSIPYPWGLTEACSLDSRYLLSCTKTENNTSSQLFLGKGNIEILNISLSGELRVLLSVATDCYNENGERTTPAGSYASLVRFPFSPTRNKFVAIGCDTYAVIKGGKNEKAVTTGCLSVCQNETSVTDGSCSGIGCCQTSIPKGLLNYNITLDSFNNHSGMLGFNPCSYSFLAEENSFNFSKAYLTKFQRRFSSILDWDIGEQRCAELTASTNICSKSMSTCYDTDNGPGYLCNCSQGYQGNPYVPNGCEDIDECQDQNLRNKCQMRYCTNTMGSFECKCPVGYQGSGSEEQDCVAIATKPKKKSNLMIILIIGIGAGLIALVICGYSMYLVSRKRKLIELKHKFFRQNGGLMLQQQLTTHQGYSETAKIYTKEELEKATNMYDETRVIGRGGYGTVYKGILPPDNKVVAIKKSKLVDNSQIEQFINEVVVLSQVNHRNVVKLLGCCLETEVPLLVYEFVSNGTLFEHIHEQVPPMSWDTRLRITAETAGVLAYLHSSASIPIIHRDVKSTNILLDENFIAKVSDFGASRLVPFDQAELSTMVQGTLGYLDPEYLQTSQLTEKSDVYSFGVVLVELLTGRKPLSFDMPEKQRCLANFFLASLKEDELFPILEEVVSKEANLDQVKEVANLAKLCLRVKGDDRPTMKEVAMELEGLRVMGKQKHAWANGDAYLEEAETLLGAHIGDSSSYNLANAISVDNGPMYDSMQNHVILKVGDAR